MALKPSTAAGRMLSLYCDKLAPFDPVVVSIEGYEAVSRLYRFEVGLIARKNDIDPKRVLMSTASVGIKDARAGSGGSTEYRTHLFAGVVSSFEQRENTDEWTVYRATVVPRLWTLTRSVRSRVFLGRSVVQVLEQVLEEYGLKTAADPSFSRAYPAREYIVQYEETDFDFLSRLLEHEGIFYYFRQREDGEILVLGDSNAAFPDPADEDRYPYRPVRTGTPDWKAGSGQDEPAIHAFTSRHAPPAGTLILQDYNYRHPRTKMDVVQSVAGHGAGGIQEYGDHYKDEAEGKALAKIRAEELLCREHRFHGESDIRTLRSAKTVTVLDHYRPDFNRAYRLIEVWHHGSQSVPLTGDGTVEIQYTNEFTALPADQAYRPERLTYRPRIPGVLHAWVDGATQDAWHGQRHHAEYAELDAQGRYRVRLPFDIDKHEPGKASHPVRMAQPYAGPDYGIHFPLHKGTEILLAHVGGDPDRPVIAGAVPNPEISSPVFNEKQTKCRIRTGGRNEWWIEDHAEQQRMWWWTPTRNTLLHSGRHCAHPHWGGAPDPKDAAVQDNPERIDDGVTALSEGFGCFGFDSGFQIFAGRYGVKQNETEHAELMKAVVKKVNEVRILVSPVGDWTRDLAEYAEEGAAKAAEPEFISFRSPEPRANGVIGTKGTLAVLAAKDAVVSSIASVNVHGCANVRIVAGKSGQIAVGETLSLAAGGANGGKAEFGCHKGQVHINAETKDIKVTAHTAFVLDAETEDVVVDANRKNVSLSAQEDFFIRTRKGRAEASIEDEIFVESRARKKIHFQTGDSELILEPGRITLKTDGEVVVSAKKRLNTTATPVQDHARYNMV